MRSDQIRLKLIRILKISLPGRSAQLKLAPETREFIPLPENYINASVLLLVHYPQNTDEPELLFMKRPEYNGYHSGQVSFPGGKSDESDSGLEITALRECHEEVGISAEKIEILGKITPLYIPVSNYLVHPFIGFSNRALKLNIDPNEVEYTFTSSLDSLLSLKICSKQMLFQGRSYEIPYFDIKNEMVWGATAMILNEFIEILKKIW